MNRSIQLRYGIHGRLGASLAVFAVVVLASCTVGMGGAPLVSETPASVTPEATLPPDKQTDKDRRLAALAAASAANASLGATKGADSGSPNPGPSDGGILEPHFTAGAGMVIESTDPAPGLDAPITNHWFESPSPADFVSVFAGRDATDVSQGIVLVSHGMPGDVQRFNAPGAHGALEIVGAVGEVLTLHGEDGSTLYFDVSTLSFH